MKSSRILVVSQDKNDRTLLQVLLEQHSYDVVTAASGMDMFKLLEDDADFDLVALDFARCGMDAAEIVRALHSRPETQSLSVLLLAEPELLRQRGQIFFGGEVDFVAKPLQASEMLAHVAGRLYTRRLKEERAAYEQRFEDLFSLVKDAVLVLDADQRVMDMNWAACGLFQRSRGELLTMKFSDLCQCSAPPAGGHNLSALQPGTTLQGYFTRRDGSLVHVEAAASTLHGHFEETHLVVIHDLTPSLLVKDLERQAHQEALTRTAELEVLHLVSQALISSDELPACLEAGVQTLVTLLGYAGGWVTLIDRLGRLSVSAQFRLPQPEESVSIFPAACQTCQQVERSDAENSVIECLQASPRLLCVPIQSGGQRLGMLHLLRRSEPASPMPNRHLLAAVANQFFSVIERARLYEETRRSLQREKRLNEVVEIINSTLDTGLILQDVVRLAAELTGADSGMIALLSAGGDQLVTMHRYNLPWGLDPDLLAGADGFGSRVLAAKKPFSLFEPQKSLEAYEHTRQARILPPAELKKMCALGLNGLMVLPIRSKEMSLGLLALFQFNGHEPFGERELQLAGAMARQAGIAIRNAQLLQDTQRRTAEVETALDASALYMSPVQQHERIDRILEQLALAVPYESAAVQVLNGDWLEIIGGRGIEELELRMGEQDPVHGEGPLKTIFETRSALLLQDAPQEYPAYFTQQRRQARAWLGMPLEVHGQIIGLLALESRQPGVFTQLHVRIASAFADEVALALESVRVFNEMQRLAVTDPLTGLYNRRHFFDLAKTELERSRRYHHSMSILILDVDHFKRVNDTFGHLVGDEVLRSLARTSLESLRKVDIMGRYGGEEFVILLPETNLTNACLMAERLRTQVAAMRVETERGVVSVTVSIGVSGFSGEAETSLDTLLNRADQALYLAKNTGRNRYALWEGEKQLPISRGGVSP